MELIIRLILFTIFINWTIAMHLLVDSTKSQRIRYIGLVLAIAFSVLSGFLVLP